MAFRSFPRRRHPGGEEDFAAQYPTRTCPCQRFAAVLAGGRRMTRRQCGSLDLHCLALSSLTSRRFRRRTEALESRREKRAKSGVSERAKCLSGRLPPIELGHFLAHALGSIAEAKTTPAERHFPTAAAGPRRPGRAAVSWSRPAVVFEPVAGQKGAPAAKDVPPTPPELPCGYLGRFHAVPQALFTPRPLFPPNIVPSTPRISSRPSRSRWSGPHSGRPIRG